MKNAVRQNATGAIIDLCRSGLTPVALRTQVLARLRRVVPFDAAFWATVDPSTLLFTEPHQEMLPSETIPYFIQNEFLEDDVNKWTMLAQERLGVRTLKAATDGLMDASARHRDIFRPMGLGDELRAVLRTGRTCWGLLCLHREAGGTFSGQEVREVRELAPHLAKGIRAGLLAASVELADPADAPGLVIATTDGAMVSMTDAGARWLDELGHPDIEHHGLPIAMRAVVADLQRSNITGAETPRLRVRGPGGRWAVLHASWMLGVDSPTVAVIIEQPTPSELAPVLMMAYGLTSREQVVTQLVCRGLSTQQLAEQLHITPNTVQDHLKSIFDKTGVSSRPKLVATILQEQYLPRTMSGTQVGTSGFFTS